MSALRGENRTIQVGQRDSERGYMPPCEYERFSTILGEFLPYFFMSVLRVTAYLAKMLGPLGHFEPNAARPTQICPVDRVVCPRGSSPSTDPFSSFGIQQLESIASRRTRFDSVSKRNSPRRSLPSAPC